VRHAHLSDRAPTYHSVTGHTHFHLVCRNCHRVISVDADVAHDLADRLRTELGFHADLGHLTLHGRCGDCAGEVP
jgi:Fur family ferric uptake transcriptional regulator